MHITRRVRFSAAHKLFNKNWSDKKNEDVFGQCAHPNWHGHNYELFVSIKGNVNPETGFVINLHEVSKIIDEFITKKVDHKNLNLDVDFLKGKITSTEVIAIEFWKQLEKPIKKLGAKLYCVKLIETENNYVEYFGT